VSDYRAFFGESFYVRCLFAEKRFWDEKWKVSIYMSGIFEHFIEYIPDVFSDGVAIRLDNHASSHIRIFCEIGDFDDIIISFTIVFSAGSYLVSHNI